MSETWIYFLKVPHSELQISDDKWNKAKPIYRTVKRQKRTVKTDERKYLVKAVPDKLKKRIEDKILEAWIEAYKDSPVWMHVSTGRRRKSIKLLYHWELEDIIVLLRVTYGLEDLMVVSYKYHGLGRYRFKKYILTRRGDEVYKDKNVKEVFHLPNHIDISDKDE